MKQPLNNKIDMLGLINNIQTQIIALDKKMDILINRSLQTNPSLKPSGNISSVLYKN